MSGLKISLLTVIILLSVVISSPEKNGLSFNIIAVVGLSMMLFVTSSSETFLSRKIDRSLAIENIVAIERAMLSADFTKGLFLIFVFISLLVFSDAFNEVINLEVEIDI